MIIKVLYGKRNFNIIGEGIINNTPVLIFKIAKHLYGLPIKTIRERVKQNNAVIKNSVYNSDYLDKDKILVSESSIIRTRNVGMLEVAVHHMNNELMLCDTSIMKYASDYEITFDSNMNIKVNVRKNTIFEGSIKDFMGFKANMITAKVHELIVRNINIVFANRNRPNLTAILDRSFRISKGGMDVSVKNSKTNTKNIISMSEIDFEGLLIIPEDQIVNRIMQTLSTIEKEENKNNKDKENDNMKEKNIVTEEIKNIISQKCLGATHAFGISSSNMEHIAAFDCSNTEETGEVVIRVEGVDATMSIDLQDMLNMSQTMFNSIVLKHLKEAIIEPVNKQLVETHKVDFDISDGNLQLVVKDRKSNKIEKCFWSLYAKTEDNINNIIERINNKYQAIGPIFDRNLITTPKKEKHVLTDEEVTEMLDKVIEKSEKISQLIDSYKSVTAVYPYSSKSRGDKLNLNISVKGCEHDLYICANDVVMMNQSTFNEVILNHLRNEIIEPVNQILHNAYQLNFVLVSNDLTLSIRNKSTNKTRDVKYDLRSTLKENIDSILAIVKDDKENVIRNTIINFFKSYNMIIPTVTFDNDTVYTTFNFGNPNIPEWQSSLYIGISNMDIEKTIGRYLNEALMPNFLDYFANTMLSSEDIKNVIRGYNLAVSYKILTNITEPTIEFTVRDFYTNTMEYYFCGKDLEKSIKELSLALCRDFKDEARSIPITAPANQEPTTSIKDLPPVEEVVLSMNILDRMYADYHTIKDFEKRVLNNNGKLISIKYLTSGYVDILINMNSTDRHFTILNGLVVEIKDVDF